MYDMVFYLLSKHMYSMALYIPIIVDITSLYHIVLERIIVYFVLDIVI